MNLPCRYRVGVMRADHQSSFIYFCASLARSLIIVNDCYLIVLNIFVHYLFKGIVTFIISCQNINVLRNLSIDDRSFRRSFFFYTFYIQVFDVRIYLVDIFFHQILFTFYSIIDLECCFCVFFN